MKALVLGGGSIKGSWQAGAIRGLLKSGFRPDIVTGISVGALNTAYLASMHSYGNDWSRAGSMLAGFWAREITGPEKIARKRPWYELAYRVLFKKWDGVIDTAPLAKLIGATFPKGAFAYPEGKFLVGTVSLRTGEMAYVPSTDPGFLDAVLASTAEPAVMPLRRYAGDLCCDGGIRDITPLAEAIHQGADEIVAVVCQPSGMGDATGNWGDLLTMIQREVSIVESEILKNDLRVCSMVNQMVEAGIAPGKKRVTVTVIRPAAPLPIDVMAFGPADIAKMVELGEKDALAGGAGPTRIVTIGPGSSGPLTSPITGGDTTEHRHCE